MNVLPTLDILSVVAFAAAVVIGLIPASNRGPVTSSTKGFMLAAAGLYVLVGILNALEHLGISTAFTPFEDFAELLFIPLLTYVGISMRSAQQLEEVRAAEQRAREGQDLVGSIVETTPTGILVIDGEARIVTANSLARKMLGLHRNNSNEDWVLPPSEVNADFVRRPFVRYFGLGQLVGGPSLQADQQLFFAPDGRTCVIEVSTSPLLDESGEPKGSVVALVDATQRVQTDHELTQYRKELEHMVSVRTAELMTVNDQLEIANRTKRDFLARMSHELRTPLNSIIGFTGLMLQGMTGPLNEEQTRQLEMVQHSGSQLLELVNDVLDIERIEAGGVKVTSELVDIALLAPSIVESMCPVAQQRHLTCVTDIEPDTPTVVTDSDKLGQIVRNLVSNAIKFTDPEGTITLKVGRHDDHVDIAVMDTGVGIAEDELGTIFETFRQIDSPDRTRPPGSGLGLAICRELCELLGATIGVVSVLGEGSTFTVHLPISRPECVS